MRKSLEAGLTVPLLALVAILAPASAFGIDLCSMQLPVMCTTNPPYKTCSATRTGATGVPNFTIMTMNNVTMCTGINMNSISRNTYFARAMTTAPATRTCNIYVTFAMNPPNNCLINSGRGLPVELMEFEVEATAPEATD